MAVLARPRIAGTVGSLFLIAYGVLRIIGEMFKEPEALYGAMPLGLSAGQWLSVPMVIARPRLLPVLHAHREDAVTLLDSIRDAAQRLIAQRELDA